MKELEKERYREEMVKKEAADEAQRIKHQRQTATLRRKHAEVEEKRAENCRRIDPVRQMIDNICCEESQPKKLSRKKRKTLDRPENWAIIAEHYGQWGMRNTIRNFHTELGDRTSRSADQALRAWLADLKANKLPSPVDSRAPAYGNPIDLIMLENVKIRIEAGRRYIAHAVGRPSRKSRQDRTVD